MALVAFQPFVCGRVTSGLPGGRPLNILSLLFCDAIIRQPKRQNFAILNDICFPLSVNSDLCATNDPAIKDDEGNTQPTTTTTNQGENRNCPGTQGKTRLDIDCAFTLLS
jgi:hypothetical protein